MSTTVASTLPTTDTHTPTGWAPGTTRTQVRTVVATPRMAHTVASGWVPRTIRGPGRIRAVQRPTVRMDRAPRVRPITRAPGRTDKHARAPTSMATCLLYTSDAADERSSVDLGG